MKSLLPCLLVATLAGALPAADAAVLTPADPIAVATIQGSSAKPGVVPVAGQPFPAAVRLQVAAASEQDWMVNLLVPVEGAVTEGEMLELEFWIRADAATGVKPAVRVVHQRTSAPFNNAIEEPLRPKPVWERKVVAYQARRSWAAGESRIGFFVGATVQTVEIGGVVLRRRTR